MTRRFLFRCRSLRRFFGIGWLAALVLSGCGEKISSSSPIFFEFKQQPGDKYVYSIWDQVNWTVTDSAGKVFNALHEQEQKSVMKFLSIDTNAVREVNLSFIITSDTILSTTDSLRLKNRKSSVGNKFDLQLRMRPNGSIVSVESPRPGLTFFYDTGYRPSQPAFPEHAIARGYAWTQNFTINVPSGEPSTVSVEYQFSDVIRIGDFDCAVIAFKSELRYVEAFKPKDGCAPAECVGQYNCRATSEGKLYFAYREGFVVKKENLITTTAEASLRKNGKMVKLSNTVYRDREKINLVAIYRNSGEKTTYDLE